MVHLPVTRAISVFILHRHQTPSAPPVAGLSWKRYSPYSPYPRVLTPRQLENLADDPRNFHRGGNVFDNPTDIPGAFENFFRSSPYPFALIDRRPNSLPLGWRTGDDSPTRTSPPPRSPPIRRAQGNPPVCTACYSRTSSVLSRAHSQTLAFTSSSTVVPPGGALEPSSLEAPIHSGARVHSQIVPYLPCPSASSLHDSPI